MWWSFAENQGIWISDVLPTFWKEFASSLTKSRIDRQKFAKKPDL
jgi:hypothetical protein